MKSPPDANEPASRAAENEAAASSVVWRGMAGFWEKAGAWALPRDERGGGYANVWRGNGASVGFCGLCIFASSFGQTFLLSLFQLHWIGSLGLDSVRMGSLYGGATLASGLALPFVGRWLDRARAETLATVMLLGLAVCAVLAASAVQVWMLALALFGLRFFGQGFASNLGMTSAARWFTHDRGKAVSLAGLGFPLGEATLPVLVTALIATAGWRWTWAVLAGFIAGVLLPLSRWLLARRARTLRAQAPDESSNGVVRPPGKTSAPDEGVRRRVLRDVRFYLMLGVLAPVPFVGTGVIFFQATLRAERGWSPAVFAGGFMVFASLRASCVLVAGSWVDRLGALRLIAVPVLAFSLALICLLRPEPAWAFGFFALLGVSFGTSGAVMTAIWAELFGAAVLGTVRSLSSSVAIFTTAAAPVLFGAGLGSGWPTEALIVASVVLLLAMGWTCSVALRRRQTRAAR